MYLTKDGLIRKFLVRDNGSSVDFANKDEFHRLLMSRYLLVRAEIYSESTFTLFYSGAV